MAEMMRVSAQPAYVLHTREYRNTSLVVEAITRDHGRVGLVARGIRGRQTARRALVQPFRPLRLAFSGRGELKNLGEVEPGGVGPTLHGDAQVCAWYLNELLLKLLPRDDPHEEVFALYAATLPALADDGRERHLRLFEHRLLAALGYGLALDADTEGRAFEADRFYDYRAAAGFAPAGALVADEAARVQGRCLIALREGVVGPECSQALQRLLARALREHLGERPLRTRRFLSEVRRLRQGGAQR